MIQTGIDNPTTTGLSFYLETPTIDSYKSFAMAVSKVSPYTGHGLACQISQLEYFCLEADHKITIGNNCIYDSKNQWWNLNNDVIHVTNHISSDDTEMTISWIDYNETRTDGQWHGFIQIGNASMECIQIINTQSERDWGKVILHNWPVPADGTGAPAWVEAIENVTSTFMTHSKVFGYFADGDSVPIVDESEGGNVVPLPDGEIHFVMTFKTEDDGSVSYTHLTLPTICSV